MIQVYGYVFDNLEAPTGKQMIFCEKEYFDKYHHVEKDVREIYNDIIWAFNAVGFGVSDEESKLCNIIFNDMDFIKERLLNIHHIELITDNEDFERFLTQLP